MSNCVCVHHDAFVCTRAVRGKAMTLCEKVAMERLTATNYYYDDY